MELDKVIALIQAVSDSSLTGFVLDEGNLHLELQKMPVSKAGIGEVEKQEAAVQEAAVLGTGENLRDGEVVESGKMTEAREFGELETTMLQQDFGEQKQAEAEVEVEGTPVCSPLVGTFYCAPSEGEEPFVKVGDRVKKGQVLGIIEAMKLMNEIECEQDGVVTAVLVENEQMVEYGQKLFLIGSV